ncbi:MAG: flagellar hook-basal body complex protein [Cellvibrio sp.]|jgi:fagellar hook-basal body proteins
MSFNTALSGIRASNFDLQVTGNNIANAGTIGFKSSRVEFGDLYSASILGSAGNMPGSGVTLNMIRQDFGNGNPKLTERDLDLAVNGAGFFVLSNQGDRLFTRAGAFGLDDDGYVVSSTGAYLQGFSANASGNISGILGNLRVDVNTQAPRQTTGVRGAFNLDSNETVLETVGSRFGTDGAAVGVTQVGLQEATTTVTNLGAVATPIDFTAQPTSFQISLAGSSPASGNGTVSINLNTSVANSVQDVVNLINSAIFSAATPINVQAVANGGNIEFRDLTEGASSTITLSGVTGGNALSTALNNAGPSVAGVPAATNGYLPQTLEITGPTGATITFTSDAAASAAQTASELNALAGITASARTTATLYAPNFNNNNGNLTLNGVTLTATNLAALANEINALRTSTLPGISATVNTAGDLEIVSSVGTDLRFSFAGPLPAGQVDLQGRPGTGMQTINNINDAAVIGGSISILMDEGYAVASSNPAVGNLFAPLTPASFTDVPINAFDPTNQNTYNHATANPIFDSLGNPHILSQYFVKQPYDPADPSTSPNHWVMYVQIDGQNVGDPDPTLPPPANTVPTMASFNVHFNSDGTLNTTLTDTILISNWVPLGEDGEPNGALPPLNVLQGGTTPVLEPPASSNFEIDLTGSTQFGSSFAVDDYDQNGYATGRLAGLDVSSTGIIFARFTNGEAQVLGQVALANFNNIEGLKPVGNTMWAQTFETGEAIIGAPGSSSLGNITAGALEESNVDLSEELVNLIIAQRNFQANAKTIETANATTQTIINLR